MFRAFPNGINIFIDIWDSEAYRLFMGSNDTNFAEQDAKALASLREGIRLAHAHTEAEKAIVHGDWPFVCPYCSGQFQTPDDKGSFPYCGTICAISAQVDL